MLRQRPRRHVDGPHRDDACPTAAAAAATTPGNLNATSRPGRHGRSPVVVRDTAAVAGVIGNRLKLVRSGREPTDGTHVDRVSADRLLPAPSRCSGSWLALAAAGTCVAANDPLAGPNRVHLVPCRGSIASVDGARDGRSARLTCADADATASPYARPKHAAPAPLGRLGRRILA